MGIDLFNLVIESTGLPPESVSRELTTVLNRHGKTPENMTLDDLREVLSEYLQDVLLEAKSNFQR